MTPQKTTHISEEAFDDVLIGLGSPESEAHLAGCPDCRVKIETLQSDVHLFNSASLAWSEARAGRYRQPAAGRSGLRTRIAFVSWTATAVVLLAMAIAIWHHGLSTPANRADTAQSQPADSQAQIAEDNELMRAVDAAISPDEESPIDEYNILESRHSRSRAHPK
jgi:hypothetical protein